MKKNSLDLKIYIKSLLGSRLSRAIANGSCWWWFDRRYRLSKRRLFTFHNKHMGERCFILGNGPSLNKMDLSLLKGEITFGLNRIYLLFNHLGFATTYFVSVNKLVIEQFAEEILVLPSPKFLNWDARDLIDFSSNMMFLTNQYNPMFQVDITEPIWQGSTVTYVAMQIAFFMGFKTVFLIGVDHSFATKGDPNKAITSNGDDPNHFSSEYFGRGVRWQLPDLKTSELAYTIAKFQFERNNRRILDATIDGKLQIFPKTDYYDIFR